MLDFIEMSINNAPIVSTDYSALFLNYRYHPLFLTDVPDYCGPRKKINEYPRQFWTA